MRSIVWLLLLACAAVVAALVFGRNDGLVSVFWRGWRADLSLNFFLLAMTLLCALLMTAAHGMRLLVSLPRRAAKWRAERRAQAAQAALREALAEYFSARYSRSYKAAGRALTLLDGSTEDREFIVLGRLLAAGSLHRLQDHTRRDEELTQLFELLRAPGANTRADDGARLLAAEWALDDRNAARASEVLAELPPGAARRTQALRLRLQAARQSRRPLEALHTARLLSNHRAFSADVARGLLRALASEALRGAHDIEQLRRLWHEFDASDRADPQVAARAAERAARLGAFADGREWLLPIWETLSELEADDRERVALALTTVSPGIGADWLARLEAAARDFAHDPAVLVAVGTAYAERRLWGMARLLLERAADAPALPSETRRRVWMHLATIARAEADEERARACEKSAVAIDF